MFRHKLRLPSPALVLSMIALALVLGGTAVAATVSDPDKAADTALVKALAPTLSVEHAHSASLLGGKTAASLQTRAYSYTLPATFGASTNVVNLSGLPAGLYDASYDITWHLGTSGQSVGCYFVINNDSYALSYGAANSGTYYVSTVGSGLIDTRTHTAQLQCFVSSGTYAIVPDNPVPDVTLVRVDKATSLVATVPAAHRQAPRLGGAALGGR